MTSIMKPNCRKRECVHYLGLRDFGKTEDGDDIYINICEAFPEGIPYIIAYGDNLHLKPLRSQGNNIVYEKKDGL